MLEMYHIYINFGYLGHRYHGNNDLFTRLINYKVIFSSLIPYRP